jgi:hypothetical protein
LRWQRAFQAVPDIVFLVEVAHGVSWHFNEMRRAVIKRRTVAVNDCQGVTGVDQVWVSGCQAQQPLRRFADGFDPVLEHINVLGMGHAIIFLGCE